VISPIAIGLSHRTKTRPMAINANGNIHHVVGGDISQNVPLGFIPQKHLYSTETFSIIDNKIAQVNRVYLTYALRNRNNLPASRSTRNEKY
jgi:hypothetical protein